MVSVGLLPKWLRFARPELPVLGSPHRKAKRHMGMVRIGFVLRGTSKSWSADVPVCRHRRSRGERVLATTHDPHSRIWLRFLEFKGSHVSCPLPAQRTKWRHASRLDALPPGHHMVIASVRLLPDRSNLSSSSHPGLDPGPHSRPRIRKRRGVGGESGRRPHHNK
jgi:hypothetical protein